MWKRVYILCASFRSENIPKLKTGELKPETRKEPDIVNKLKLNINLFIYLFRKRCVQNLMYYHFNCEVMCLVLFPSTPPIRETSDATGKWQTYCIRYDIWKYGFLEGRNVKYLGPKTIE